MKYELPTNYSLSEQIVATLVYTEDGVPALTDAQYAALEAGLGEGASLLVVSPTSTGKTQIAVWAIANGIETNTNTVYLVTHRALAKQKFHDFQELLLADYLSNDFSKIVLATGDAVVDGAGESPADPLRSPVLVATYEKYLAMLSAVLDTKDGTDLSNWLNVVLVRATTREKDLRYEYWSPSGIESVTTSLPEETVHDTLPTGVIPGTLEVLRYLENQEAAPVPVIVFCMRKQDVYDLALADLEGRVGSKGPQLPLDLGDLPDTTANSFLAKALAHRIAIHSADLTDEERKIVEDGLLDGRVDVVYATSTLAAGVNFPLGAAIFHKWVRWDGDQRTHLPIDSSEFHNMAGRVGRMGCC